MRDLYDGAKPFNEYAKAVLKRPANKKLATGKTTTTKIPIPDSDYRTVPEKKVQAEILDWLRGRGWWVYKAKAVNLVGSGDDARLAVTDRGVPDILAVSPAGRFYGIEVKAASATAKTDQHQIRQITRLRELGVSAFFAHSVQVVDDYLAYEERGGSSWPLIPTLKQWEHFRSTKEWPER